MYRVLNYGGAIPLSEKMHRNRNNMDRAGGNQRSPVAFDDGILALWRRRVGWWRGGYIPSDATAVQVGARSSGARMGEYHIADQSDGYPLYLDDKDDSYFPHSKAEKNHDRGYRRAADFPRNTSHRANRQSDFPI